MAIKLEGGGGKALMAWPLVEELFFAASLIVKLFNFERILSFLMASFSSFASLHY